MIDAHVHLDKGELTEDWVRKFINIAIKRNIDEVYLLQHTNVFTEFMYIYEEMKRYNDYQYQWVTKKEQNSIPISKYIDFIENIKEVDFPIKIKYGFEVCYSPIYEEYISNVTKKYKFDFLVGSIHTINGWAFSHLKQKWSEKDTDIENLYTKYYEIMFKLITSKLFDGLAHPSSLSCYGVYPKTNFSDMYDKLSKALVQENMYTELNSGLALNYGRNDFGINMGMLNSMKENGVTILTASDAHKPEDVGLFLNDIQKYLM